MNPQRVPLRECGTWLSGGTPSKSNDEYWEGEIPWISGKSIHDFYIRDSEERVTEAGAENETTKVDAGAVLILVRGMSLTEEIRVGITKRPVVFNQDVKAILPADGVDPLYLANAIRGSESQILSLVDEASHGTGRLRTDTLGSFEIPLPPLPVQRRVADILGALDDKIEVNRRMSETLEEMAQALYRHWFVDFGPFQDREFKDTEELGPIPREWEVTPLGDMIDFVNGYAFKSDQWQEEGVPVIKIGSVKPGVVDLDDNVSYISFEDAEGTKSRYRLRPGDLLIGMTGYVGEVGIVPPGEPHPFLNQRVGRFGLPSRGTTDLPFYYCLTRRPDFRKAVENRASGTAQSNVSATSIKSIPVVNPPDQVVDDFNDRLQGNFDLILSNLAENQTLAETRDYLLPKLISGEIEVEAAHEMAEETVEATS